MTHRRIVPLTLLTYAITCALTAQAKDILPVLTAPENGNPLPNTPYFMSSAGEKPQTQPLLTNAKGQTRPVKTEPDVLVEAEGFGKTIFISNLTKTQYEDIKVDRGAPYMVFNPINNQALCARVNEKGFTRAYYMDNADLWYDNAIVLQLQKQQKCSDARSTVSQLVSNNSEKFAAAYDIAPQKFVLTDTQHKAFLYEHINSIIQDKSIDLSTKASSKIIDKGTQVALQDSNSERLNGIGYSLGFERQDYKRGLKLLDESLRINPKDCYATNSKGYLLMRQGDLTAARPYFYASDESCRAEAVANKDNPESKDYNYPIAVNYAHLAENYGLSGDTFLANDFFNRAIRVGSKTAKDEIAEVAKRLREQKILSQDNIDIYTLYMQYVERPNDEASQPVEQKPTKTPKKVKK